MKPRLGDLFEFTTPCGLAYLQYIHDERDFGTAARVLSGVHPKRLDQSELAILETRFVAYVPIRAAIRAGALAPVGNFPVPEGLRSPLVVRAELGADGGVRHGWRLYQGTTELGHRRDLTDAERELPVRTVWSFGLLVERVASAWSWSHEYGPVPRASPGPHSPCHDIIDRD